ncbi:hypothetical protein H5410_046678 [Solanum commersonii]|uniref:Uncharacterized protein n=1 Tax=Solanum commersonii TaxID=4109 RepID=A0A9J5XG62_SOLCO|nr:hypothetical protein H5410_046678 [Solanum commersonii]
MYSFQKLCCSGSFSVVRRDHRSTGAHHTGTKYEDKTFWRFAKRVRRFSDLHFFVLSAAFVPLFAK